MEIGKEISAYQTAIKLEFASLKAIARFDELVAHSIPIADNQGYLLCVSEFHTHDKQLIQLLAKWRADAKTFHNKFNVTIESTERWLRKLLLDVPDRILFLVLNPQGYPVGHMGFANALNDGCLMEFDNVIRGVPDQNPGLMGMATKTLLAWAENMFHPKAFYLRTLDDNKHALHFYEKLGFELDGKQPLRRIENNGEVNHLPLVEGDTAPPDKYFICMKLNPTRTA